MENFGRKVGTLCMRLEIKLCFFFLQPEWRYFLAGGTTKPKEIPNPSPDWISPRSWNDILTTAALDRFADFPEDFKNHLPGFKQLFDSVEPHRYRIYIKS